MQYSLQSRFQGAFLGAALGEILGLHGTSQLRVPLPMLQLGSAGGDSRGLTIEADSLLPGWGNFACYGCKSLIDRGHLQLDRNRAGNAVESTGITLPVALFCHEDEKKLRQQLHQVAAICQFPIELKQSILAIGYCLSQALKETLDPSTLIPQIVTYLQPDPASTDLQRQLLQVQVLLECRAGIETAKRQLRAIAPTSSIPIALAFYCFLSTPEDFRLSVLRAVRIAKQPQVTAALTGAMSGVYNSLAGIPAEWRIAVNRPNLETSWRASGWGVTSASEILQLANRLLMTWSGASDSVLNSTELGVVYAVAAPEIIRPR